MRGRGPKLCLKCGLLPPIHAPNLSQAPPPSITRWSSFVGTVGPDGAPGQTKMEKQMVDLRGRIISCRAAGDEVSGGAVGPCGPTAPAATGHGGTEEPIGVRHYASNRTRSGRAGYAWSKAGGLPRPPRWCDRARVSANMARKDPQAAMRVVMEHYSRWSGQEGEFHFSTNEETYGFEAMIRIDCYSDRFTGRPRNTERGAEDEACKLALDAYHDQGYIVWT